MRTAIGATAVNIAKPTNLSAPMIHAFLDNIRYITIELNGLIVYDISAGANVKVVQRMLGHESAAMTLDVYADLCDDDLVGLRRS